MHGAHYIVKADDDQCPDIGNITQAIEGAKDPKYAYMGKWIQVRPVRIHTPLSCLICENRCCAQTYDSHYEPNKRNYDSRAQPLFNQKGSDGQFIKYFSGWVYALSFSLARLITFEDFNYASLYPMCVPCDDPGQQIEVIGGGAFVFSHEDSCRILQSLHFRCGVVSCIHT